MLSQESEDLGSLPSVTWLPEHQWGGPLNPQNLSSIAILGPCIELLTWLVKIYQKWPPGSLSIAWESISQKPKIQADI